jgi:hypothetical protein
MAITERETGQIDEANASGRPAVVLIHGLWLLPSSWDRWSAGWGGGVRGADSVMAG